MCIQQAKQPQAPKLINKNKKMKNTTNRGLCPSSITVTTDLQSRSPPFRMKNKINRICSPNLSLIQR
ncbi:hypothetical protein PIB30_084788, partial [Stylosanthes scabra]|nr:hypothetical protein [Stylosanthes scabra]